MNVLQVCHLLPLFTIANIPLLLVLKVKHEEYFKTEILLFL
jgi:hypothetical protein